MTDTHVVLGATGALGVAIVQSLAEEEKTVRAVVRDSELARQILPSRAGIVVNDLSKPEEAVKACDGATVVYDCVDVRYSEWEKWLPGITTNILTATKDVGARLLFPSPVFGYGPLQSVPATEAHPRAATGKKGRLRNSLEEQLMEAHRSGSVPVVIPRFPDFYGPFVLTPLMSPIFEAALEGKTAGWPGRLDVPHDLIFVEDAARACILLAETESAYGRSWHVPGAGPLTGRRFIEMVFDAAGNRPKMKELSRRLFRFFGMMIPDAGEMVEILHLFEQPMVLDGSAFAAQFPDFRYTPHKEAIRKTVDWFRHH